MSITDELRGFASNWDWLDRGSSATERKILTIADRIDAEYQKAKDEWIAKGGQSWLHGYEECRIELIEGNEVIAASLEEAGWVKLPLDAEGKIIHVGDVIDTEHFGTVEVEGFVHNAVAFYNYSGQPAYLCTSPANLCHHHEPTVEDVLKEFAQEMNENMGMYTSEAIDADEWRDADAKTVKKFAAKLQLRGDGE